MYLIVQMWEIAMKKKFTQHILIRRGLVTLGIIFIFLLGRKIPLPYLSGSLIAGNFITTTDELVQLNLFSLGMGPGMYGMLLAQLWTISQRRRIESPTLVDIRQHLLVLVVAIIQGTSLAIRISNDVVQVLEIVLIVVAGAFIVRWLGQINQSFGIGGSVLLILISILVEQFRTVEVMKVLWASDVQWWLWYFLGWIFVTLLVVALGDKAEYRIPVERISIHNSYSERIYMPIRVNVAGGMPLMYAYSFVKFPVYILLLLVELFPDWNWLEDVSAWFDVTSLSGTIFYLLMVLFLTYLLAFVNVDVVQLTEDFRKSGDYIPHVRPGRDTKNYLSRYLIFFAGLNSFFLLVLAGVPMLVSLKVPVLSPLATVIGALLMVAGMILQVREEVSVMVLKKQYQSLFD